MVHITLLTETPKQITAEITDTNCTFVNALRRVMIANVKTWAIENVQFEQNNTIIPDEVIAHTLGLLPLVTTRKFDGTGSFEFDKQAADSSEIEEWVADEMMGTVGIKLAIRGIPIAKATRGQALKFIATIAEGSGEIHSKWSPVTKCFFNSPDPADPTRFNFYITSKGQLSAREILDRGLEELTTILSGESAEGAGLLPFNY